MKPLLVLYLFEMEFMGSRILELPPSVAIFVIYCLFLLEIFFIVSD